MSRPRLSLEMKLDKEGFHMFFKPWQYKIIKHLLEKNTEQSSKQLWEPIRDEISRASVIHFVEDMVFLGLIDKTDTTGKGGHRGIYTIKYNEKQLKTELKKRFQEKLNTI